MREDEKKVLIEWLIGQRDACDEIHGDDCKREPCITAKIALASLTAEPAYFINRIDGVGDWGFEQELRTYETKLDALKSKDDHGGIIVSTYTTPPAPSAPTEPVSTGYTLPDGWIKCSDMLPDENEGYYLTHSNAGVDVTAFYDGHFQDQYATHWMPLPEPPEVQ